MIYMRLASKNIRKINRRFTSVITFETKILLQAQGGHAINNIANDSEGTFKEHRDYRSTFIDAPNSQFSFPEFPNEIFSPGTFFTNKSVDF